MPTPRQKSAFWQRGFTLIELLVVIGIIGILSGIVLSSLQSSRKKAGDAAVIQEMNSLRTAMALYRDSQTASYNLSNTSGSCNGINAKPSGLWGTLISSLQSKAQSVNVKCFETSGSGDYRKFVVAVKLPSSPTGSSDPTKWYCIDWELRGKLYSSVTASPGSQVYEQGGQTLKCR